MESRGAALRIGPWAGRDAPALRGTSFDQQAQREPMATMATMAIMATMTTVRSISSAVASAAIFKRFRRCTGNAFGNARVVQVSDAEDPRVTLYKARSQRDCTAFDMQVRSLAEAALKLRSNDMPQDEQEGGRRKRLKPLNKLDCIVDVHYSEECLRQLHDALQAGFRIHVDSVLLPQLGAPAELRSLASAVAPTLYLSDPEILAEFRQDVPWIPTDFMESKDARLFRRFDGCRFLVAFPCSIPIAEMVPPFVVLDGLNSASNVGQVLRTAYHLGVNSVIVSPGAWSCLNGRACRVSMGWFYRMSFHVARPLSKAIQELKQLGVCLYVAENQFSQPVAPHQPHGDRKWALVIGSEFSGVSEEIVQECDQRVCVPQQQGHSLNVAHACSICLYELSKFNVMELVKESPHHHEAL